MFLFYFLLYFSFIFSSCFSTKFVVKIDAENIQEARQIAEFYGFTFERKLTSFNNLYVINEDIGDNIILEHIIQELLEHEKVHIVEKLENFTRFKRQPIGGTKKNLENLWQLKPSMKIEEAWKTGFNGSTVTIAIVDDGVDESHIDLKTSFSPSLSFDFVKFGTFPTPDKRENELHGTQCAGLVSMSGEKCGLGVGHGSILGGIKLLGPSLLNDALEADALAFQSNKIDIYSVSWGPKDDGKTADGPKTLTSKAISDGTRRGRMGKGNIFVWASGNGGKVGDNCALDGYVSNEYTLTFGVIDSTGSPAFYAEGCSAVLSAISGGDSSIRTTGFDSKCSQISGSSASAAIASGIIGLALQANPRLTQRDVQKLIIESSDISEIRNISIQTNGIGLKFHPNVGFGLLNAEKMVERAKNWKNVGAQKQSEVTSKMIYTDAKMIEIKMDNNVGEIERVILSMDIYHKFRGDLSLSLESPKGTISQILPKRPTDDNANLLNWNFVSVNFFGENPEGKWKLHISTSFSYNFRNLKFKITGT